MSCNGCGLVYVPSPAPEVTSIYKSSYNKGDHGVHSYGNYESEYKGHYQTGVRRLQEAEVILGGKGRVLDIGCSLGHFGKVALDKGWDVFVTDVSEFAVQSAKLKFGLTGFVTPPEKIPVRHKSFDFITLYGVIEHLSHPMDLLKNIHGALAKNGLLHLTTPNLDSLSAKIFKKHWYHFRPDEHLLYFKPDNIKLTLECAGFEVSRVEPAVSYMSVTDILMRLRYYSKFWSDLGLKLARFLKFDQKIFKVGTGEMEVWARPKAGKPRLPQPYPAFLEPTPLLEVVSCPNCDNDDLKLGPMELVCKSCNSVYEIESGVVNFSRYSKRADSKPA